MIKRLLQVNRRWSTALNAMCPKIFGSISYKDVLLGKINESILTLSIANVLEVGGIDRPLMSKNGSYEYDGLDVESRADCYEIYDNFHVQSVEETIVGTYDMVVSKTLLEHVVDNEKAIESIYSALNVGGVMHHYVPSKWHPYSIALRVLGPELQKRLIPLIRPEAVKESGYPAFFDHCSVPAMRKLLREQGFTEVEFQIFYRANDYFAFFIPLYIVVSIFENVCRKLNFTLFASGFVVSAKRSI